MKYIAIPFLLLIFSGPLTAFQTDLSDSLFVIEPHFIANQNQVLSEVYPVDINNDGFTDLIFRDYTPSVPFEQKTVTISFIPGSPNGLLFQNKETIISNSFINKLFIDDWDENGSLDLITQKSRFIDGTTSMTNDLIEIYFMDDASIIDSLEFSAPYEIYLGEETNPKELYHLNDLDLDGRNDMIFLGFSHITIGWSNGNEPPEFDEITNFGQNTYSTEIFDFNQDGYLDFLYDDQYWDEPAIQVNNKDRSFTRTSIGLPNSNPQVPESMYWTFDSFWYNDDHFPDLLIQRPDGDSEGGFYEIYIYDDSSSTYTLSPSAFSGNQIGQMTAIHLNNDGYADFVEVNENEATLWVNESNSSFSKIVLDLDTNYGSTGSIFYFDSDLDNDLDVFFWFQNSGYLYQLEFEGTLTNEQPTIPEFQSVSVTDVGSVNLSWNKSNDFESLEGHVKYRITVNSEEQQIILETHSNDITLTELKAGNYNVSISSIDPLQSESSSSLPANFVIILESGESSNDLPAEVFLHQNYPNPFNPVTNISFELNKTEDVKLTVFDALGRTVSTLVDERRSAGLHTIRLDASNFPSGIYFYQLEAGGVEQTKKLTLIK
ncbi:MAG: T9SS C-terminal target domain-containing protein [Balneola sp.]|nr:MAG: T9SS C-terminal target domain-containing protein [Balneola sp.]